MSRFASRLRVLPRMRLTERHKTLVKESFQQVAPIADRAAAVFYARLFEIAPEVRPLFRGNMREQGRKLMQVLAYAVTSLDRLERLMPSVEDMGRRHAGYGVRDEHYARVGEALLWTLDKGLGEAFTAEVREAWTVLYGILSGAMKNAAAEHAAAATA